MKRKLSAVICFIFSAIPSWVFFAILVGGNGFNSAGKVLLGLIVLGMNIGFYFVLYGLAETITQRFSKSSGDR